MTFGRNGDESAGVPTIDILIRSNMHPEVADTPAPDQTLDEATLVEGARARSPEAWTAIYDRHYPAVFRYVHARVFDQDAAADISSTVFAAAIQSIGAYKYTGRPILAWLYRIAGNKIADHQREMLGRGRLAGLGAPVRAARRAFGRQTREDPREVPGPASHNPDALAERLDLHRAITTLPASQREVLILRFLVGHTTAEIAELLGKERAAVYSLHARAITTLRKSLKDDAT